MLPVTNVLHGVPRRLRGKRLACLQEFDRDIVRRADKCHAAIPGRSVNDDAMILQTLTGVVNIVDGIG